MEKIYGLRDPRSSEVRYVGFTAASLEQRLRYHIYEAGKGKRVPKSCWIRRMLREGVRPEILLLEAEPVGTWQEAERVWIATLRGLGCRLTNVTDGGDAGFTYRHTEETKAKMRKPKSLETRARMKAAVKLRPPMSDETKAKLRAARLGKPLSAAHKAAIGASISGELNGMYGRTHSEEARSKISLAAKEKVGPKNGFYGKKHTPEAREKMREARRRRTYLSF